MFIYFVLYSMLVYAEALNDAEARQMFEAEVLKCAKQMNVDSSYLTELRELKVPTSTEAKCVLACTYRVLGTLDSKGMYDLNKAYEYAELVKDGVEQRLINGKKVADLCKAVNEATVTDGEKGCERSALMFKCLVEEAPKFGFKLQ